MSNQLFNIFNGGGMPHPIANMIQQFNNFKNAFSGNPQQQVQHLLNSGQMSQQEFNQIASTANSFMRLLGKK